jgi:uracil DNA glycosylase
LTCCDKIDWEVASNFIPLSEDVIDAMQDKVDWQTICAKQKISHKFLLKHIDKLDDMCLLYLKNNPYYKEEQVEVLKLSEQKAAKGDTAINTYWIRENKLGYEEVLGTVIIAETFKDAVKEWILAYDEYDEYVSKGKLLLNTKLSVTKLNSQNFKTKTYVIKTSSEQIDIVRQKTEKEGTK